MLDAFPAMLGESAAMLAPHHISFYLMELAAGLHSYYAAVPILAESSMELVKARLSMLAAVGYVLKTGLNLLGVSAPEKM
jgi:arginyl-tRNA synthetase (EC 6.1.1.19)